VWWTRNRTPRLPLKPSDENPPTANRRGQEEPDVCKAELCRDVLSTLKRAELKLCVLHGYEELPERISSDIDAFSDNPSQVPRILSEHDVATTVQLIQHEIVSFYYVLCRRCNGKTSYLSLDVSSDYRIHGRILLNSEDFLEACRPFKFFDVPPPELGFIFYLVKRLSKNALGEVQAHKLRKLYAENPAACNLQLPRFFPQEEANFIAEAAHRGDWESVQLRVGSLRQAMLRKVGHEHPLQVLRYWLGEYRRRIKRILRPTGVMVVFLGADGSGKSTVIDRAMQSLAPAFWRTARYHLRPSLRKRKSKHKEAVRAFATEPYTQPLRGRGASLAKLPYWWLGYLIGYARDIFPQLASSTLVLFDRYYYDILVDPRRYRYRGSLWPARFVGRFVPHPHLTILLDAPPEVLFARKPEVPLEEITRQRQEYLKLVRDMRDGHVVDASRPLDDVVAEVECIVLNYMAARTARRMGVDNNR
jgi:thymidylate kinase